jgi:hypothetical protein
MAGPYLHVMLIMMHIVVIVLTTIMKVHGGMGVAGVGVFGEVD